MSDITQFAVKETDVLELLGPDDSPLIGDDGKPMTVTVYGPGSKVYAKAQAVNTNKLISKVRRTGRTEQDAEELRKAQIEKAISCTQEFSPNVKYGDFVGPELARAIYTDETLGYILERVSKHIDNWAGFIPGSTKP